MFYVRLYLSVLVGYLGSVLMCIFMLCILLKLFMSLCVVMLMKFGVRLYCGMNVWLELLVSLWIVWVVCMFLVRLK